MHDKRVDERGEISCILMLFLAIIIVHSIVITEDDSFVVLTLWSSASFTYLVCVHWFS